MTTPTAHDSPDSAASLPAFTPVASLKPRHDGWTEDRQRQFLAALALYGCVAKAARAVGMSAASAYALRKRAGADSFAAAWDEAIDQGRERAFEIAVDRAVNGISVPRFYRGRFVGTTHRFDHRTIMAALLPPKAPPVASPSAKLDE
ncbi:hypothetical protein [Sphingomonas oligophenolica]|uniref:LysR family transcriptional regulator n=1 Tax=Sphingomonas oligophenolica TaxID=301154 RepID=A0A502CN62_9SPHN|nr:hypothetical protein [Sphingomonas oligophenolica]TPG13121.1 hypothetical protein EAH84_06870 [Sphingomonas oligophenolica]